MSKDVLKFECVVISGCKSNFVCRSKEGVVIKATPSGKMRQNLIEINEGDNVMIECSPYDSTHGRIVSRMQNRR